MCGWVGMKERAVLKKDSHFLLNIHLYYLNIYIIHVKYLFFRERKIQCQALAKILRSLESLTEDAGIVKEIKVVNIFHRP